MKVNHNFHHLKHNNRRKDRGGQKKILQIIVFVKQITCCPSHIRIRTRHKRLNTFCSGSITPSQSTMDAWPSSLFLALACFVMLGSGYQKQDRRAVKKLNVQRIEDYTFEGVLSRAKDECSYMSLVNDTAVRNRTLHMVKEKIGRKKLKEFYEQKEIEKQKAKEFYENLEKESRRRVLEAGGGPRWRPNFLPPRAFPPQPPPPPPPPPPFPHGNLYKRAAEFHGRRRKGSPLFSEVSFTDHNNCSSRCLFARMEMVNAYGFPDESLITKLIEDKITNRKVRLLKTKKVNSCFKKMEEVAFDDSCIFSSRLFDCLDLGESFSWSRR